MKKIISLIAALAMVGAFVGCGPIEFSPQTVIISNSKSGDTAYYITEVNVLSGGQYLEATISNESNPAYRTVTLKTLAPSGDATVEFISSVSAKRAVHSLSVMGSGTILTPLSPLARTTFNGRSTHLDSWWEDYTTKFDNKLENGYYAKQDSDDDYLLVKDNTLYYLHYKGEGVSAGFEYYYWARGIVEKLADDKVSINWDTFGLAQMWDGTGGYNTSGSITGMLESHSTRLDSDYTVTDVPMTNEENIDYFCGSTLTPKTVKFGSKTFEQITDWTENGWTWPTNWSFHD